MTQEEPAGIMALTAHAQQVLVQAHGQTQFAAEQVIARLSIGDMQVFRGETGLLPQLSCAGESMARFWRRLAFDGPQHRA